MAKKHFSQEFHKRSIWIALILYSAFILSLSYQKGVEPDPKATSSYPPFEIPEGNVQLTSSVTSDIHYFAGDDPNLFRGVCERIAAGEAGEFMITSGDFEPPQLAYNTIKNYILDEIKERDLILTSNY